MRLGNRRTGKQAALALGFPGRGSAGPNEPLVADHLRVVAGLNDIRLARTDLDLGSVRVLDGQCSMPGGPAEPGASVTV
jgi:hypothetical protein